MNIELCQKCKRKLSFIMDNEKSSGYNLLFGRRKVFRCHKDIDELTHDFGCLNISTYELTGKRWKRVNFHIFQTIPLKWSVTNWINGLLSSSNIEDIIFDDGIGDDYSCPYHMEHKMFDWNKNEKLEKRVIL